MEQPDNPSLLLRKIDVLASLSETELNNLGDTLEWRSFAPREMIVRHLEQGGDVFFIVSGSCRAHLRTPNGRTVPIRELKAGDHFGELAALTGAPRSLSVEASSASVVARCPQAAFVSFIQSNATLANAIAINLARAVVGLTDRLYEFAALEMRFRLYSELLRLARTGRHTPDGIVVDQAPTHEALATAISAQREHVTRELGQLANEGIVAQDRRTLVIRDPDKLRERVQRRGGLTASQLVDWRV